MKGQDIALLFKLVALHIGAENQLIGKRWIGWEDDFRLGEEEAKAHQFSVRGLAASLGLSKSEVANSLIRCREAGLVISDPDTSLPKVHHQELVNIAKHGLKYFFPVKLGAIVRGIPTCFDVPSLSRHLKRSGGLIAVWPDPIGTERGQAIEPLYKFVPFAAKTDRIFYHYLALVDSIRVGGPRESRVAIDLLTAAMGLKLASDETLDE